jgi:hypothetical protein
MQDARLCILLIPVYFRLADINNLHLLAAEAGVHVPADGAEHHDGEEA